MNKDTLKKDMIQALKDKDKVRLEVLRFLISLINYEEIEKKNNLTAEEVIRVLQKELKQREEALKIMEKSGKTQILEKEQKQIEIIKTYLPERISDTELEKIVDEVLNQNPNLQNPGPIIGQVMSKLKGKADGSRVAALVSQKFQRKNT